MSRDGRPNSTFDVIVVGGGPAGLTAARHARREGAAVLVIEQYGPAGDADRCAGLVSPRTIDALEPSRLNTLRSFRSAWLTGPDGRRVEICADETKALVIDRAQLNRQLAADAMAEGVILQTQSRVVSCRQGTVCVRRQGSNPLKQFHGSVIIGADGPSSRIAVWAGLSLPPDRVFAQQAVLASLASPVDEIEIFLGHEAAPGFFAWAVPAEPGTLRVGLATSDATAVMPCFHRHLERYTGRIVPASRVGGIIPVDVSPRTVAPGLLLVGDAAGQVKPLSGGGLYVGASCARIAGRIAARAARAGSPDNRDQILASYEASWRELLGHELRFGRVVHRARQRMSDHQLRSVLDLADHPGIKQVLSQSGDIDYSSRILDALIRRWDLWPGVARRLAPLLGDTALRRLRHDTNDATGFPSGL